MPTYPGFQAGPVYTFKYGERSVGMPVQHQAIAMADANPVAVDNPLNRFGLPPKETVRIQQRCVWFNKTQWR